eukprot:jgi/Botrbrau1/5637/Bobra.55_1s0026.1
MSMVLMTELYLACLPPLISYGCEVWAFRCFQGRQLSSGKPSSIPLLDAHKRVLAQILGVRRTIPEEIINCELNIFSLWSTWILRMVRFWNNIAAMRPDSLHYKVLMHDIRLAIVEGRETFSDTLIQQLKKLGYYIADHVRFDRALQIDISQVKDPLGRKSDMIWDDLDISPRTCASPRALFCRYQRWFARPPHVPRRKSALKLHLPNGTLPTFMRSRLGCHDLPIDKGRQQGIPRDQRICTKCSLELVGDEHHMLFTCPAVQHVRQQFMHLFQPRSRSVQTFMWQEDLEGVAKFVTRALESYLTLPGQRSVFGPKTTPGMFTGYCPQSKAYRVYVGNGIWKESRDVTFLEHQRGAEPVGMSKIQPRSPQWLSRAASQGRVGEAVTPSIPAGPPVNFWDQGDGPVVERMPARPSGTPGSSPGDHSKTRAHTGPGSGVSNSHDASPRDLPAILVSAGPST